MRLIFIIILFFITTINAQIYMMGVAPLKPGNYWKYVDIGGMFSDTQCFEVTDSTRNLLGLNFNIVQSFGSPNYIRYSSYKKLTTDSAYINYATYVPDSIYTYYKANCKIGDSWVQPVNEFATYTYTVIDTFHITAWGNSYFSKLIKITDFNVTEVYQVWADHFGLMEEQSVGQYHMVLRGCVINGTVFGDTTTIVSVDDENPNFPVDFKLHQNYPNPFNSTTIINYELSNPSFVTIIVYDALGNEIIQLVNETKPPGKYQVTFDVNSLNRTLSTGVYFYKIILDQKQQTRKMIYLK